ncbi:hypothetical protein [Erythrobacter sp. EC-HK427]|uniref:hypothetical protein n=1 Tax=Erythrobacter sp. EC-HK427 TaxID=2038396 RepID=UPI001254B691|nr:hypothetical protein [Erythrobacter sp. EC-HK427]VVT05328.1 conserved exported hypothetical protein [Erythrobacter sp. EC-HK427]
MKLVRSLLALTTAALLQGCVLAAAAIPLAAGGVMASNAVFGERTLQALVEGTDRDVEDVEIGDLPGYTIITASELPAPALPVPSIGPYGDLRVFAEAALPQSEDQSLEGSFSALLANPSAVQPTRARCEAGIPAVLIDLDPEGGLMPLDAPRLSDPQLRAVVSHLRGRNIAIAWMTDREPTDAARVRDILEATGLDPSRRDPLFVMRFPGEQKQRRRRALLETHCVIAMAGDTRSDFDDLFLFLRNPAAAEALDPMLGSSWFLIPNPVN